MPNFVLCGFHVVGDAAEVERFKARMITERFSDTAGKPVPFLDFAAIIPPPPCFGDHTTERRADFGGSVPNEQDFESWAVDHWGTKWDAQQLVINTDEPGDFGFQFDTAWDFPLPVFQALADEFPTLVFSGSAIEDSEDFAYRGEFNGDDDWGPTDPSTYWTIDTSKKDGEDE